MPTVACRFLAGLASRQGCLATAPQRRGKGGRKCVSAQAKAAPPDSGAVRGVIKRHATLTAPPLLPGVKMYLTPNVMEVWEDMEEEVGGGGQIPPPYWAVCWPGGQALARHLQEHPELVRGKRVLNVGAGCAVESLVAAKLGAKEAVANDIDPIAGIAIEMNTEANGVEGLVSLLIGDVLEAPTSGWDVVMAGDVCFEKGTADRMLAWLGDCAAGGAVALLGDPTSGRKFSPPVGREGLPLVRVGTYRVETDPNPLVEGAGEREVAIWMWGGEGAGGET